VHNDPRYPPEGGEKGSPEGVEDVLRERPDLVDDAVHTPTIPTTARGWRLGLSKGKGER
jgi:hypothetical protein